MEENALWHELLEKLCRHCSEQRCVSAPELAKVAQAVMQLYVTMLGQERCCHVLPLTCWAEPGELRLQAWAHGGLALPL